VKHMRVVEEEVSLSQPKTIVVPSEEEEVPVLPEEGEVPSPPPLSWSRQRKKSRRALLSRSRLKEGNALSRYHPW
jgi:hypothetical protein